MLDDEAQIEKYAQEYEERPPGFAWLYDDANKGDDDAAPVDLWAAPVPPSLPLHLLPKVIASFAHENASQTGASAAAFAVAALVACSGAIHDEVRIKVPRHEDWTERACIWGLMVGDPSVKKSPVFRKATSWLNAKNREMERKHSRDLADWQDAGGKKSGDPMPAKKRIVLNNTTSEAALEVAAADNRGLCLFSDEITGFFKRIEAYGAGDNSMWLESFNGGYQSVERVGRNAASADNFSLCILGGIQPDRIKKMREALSDDGMLQRFMPVMMEAAGKSIDAASPPVNDDYDALLAKLFRCSHKGTHNFFNKPVMFSEHGQQIREAFTDSIFEEAELMYDVNKAYSNHIRKHEALFPRLCLVWHCIEAVEASGAASDGDKIAIPVLVPDHIPERVAEFLSVFVRGHAFCFYEDLAGNDTEDNPIKDIASYILSKELDEITMREVRRHAKRFEKLHPSDREDTMLYLESASWLTKTAGPRSDSQVWKVNKQVHKLYAEQAKVERDRRVKITQRMANLKKSRVSDDT